MIKLNQALTGQDGFVIRHLITIVFTKQEFIRFQYTHSTITGLKNKTFKGQSSQTKSNPADRKDRESKSQYRKDAVLNYVADNTVKLHPVQQKLIEVGAKLT